MQPYLRESTHLTVALFFLVLAALAGCAGTVKLPNSDNTDPTIRVTVTELDQNSNTRQQWTFDDFCCDLQGKIHRGHQFLVVAKGEDDDGGVQKVQIWAGVTKWCCSGSVGLG